MVHSRTCWVIPTVRAKTRKRNLRRFSTDMEDLYIYDESLCEEEEEQVIHFRDQYYDAYLAGEYDPVDQTYFKFLPLVNKYLLVRASHDAILKRFGIAYLVQDGKSFSYCHWKQLLNRFNGDTVQASKVYVKTIKFKLTDYLNYVFKLIPITMAKTDEERERKRIVMFPIDTMEENIITCGALESCHVHDSYQLDPSDSIPQEEQVDIVLGYMNKKYIDRKYQPFVRSIVQQAADYIMDVSENETRSYVRRRKLNNERLYSCQKAARSAGADKPATYIKQSKRALSEGIRKMYAEFPELREWMQKKNPDGLADTTDQILKINARNTGYIQ